MCVLSHLSHIRLFATLQTVARQAPLTMGFSRQRYWSGLPCPPAGDLPDPGIEPMSPALAGGFFTTEPPGDNNSPISKAMTGTKTWLSVSPLAQVPINNSAS